MNSLEGAKLVIDALNKLGISYMLVGSMSSNLYAVPRSTKDADFLIETDDRIDDLQDKLKPQFRMDPQIGFETKLMTTKYVFLMTDSAFKVEVFLLSQDDHDQQRFARRMKQSQDGRTIFVPTAEDVIIQKLRWARQKDLADVADILDVQGDDALNFDYIYTWCDKHQTRELFDKIRTSDELR